MADQKAMKKRLKALMNRPENQICSDCPERQPRWASLIVPPPGAPAGSLPIGAFCCLECSGSHRRLGVHISFVRSINLDSWKEKEVLAMENGGNAKVNAIFEARLPSPAAKPSQHADGPTRERFIRDKYERRKYYDAEGFAQYAANASQQPAMSAPPPQQQQRRQVGPPSDAAKQRLELRRSRISKAASTVEQEQAPSRSRRKQQIAQAPVSAPLANIDLLDLMDSPEPAPRKKTPEPPKQAAVDLFADFVVADNSAQNGTENGAAQQQKEQLAKPPSFDIMSLYNGGGQQQQQQQNNNMFGSNGMMQQQQQPNMFGNGMQHMNSNGMMSNSNGMANNMQQMTNMMQNMQFPQQQQQPKQQTMSSPQPMGGMMPQQMYQQQMMLMQQQQRMAAMQGGMNNNNMQGGGAIMISMEGGGMNINNNMGGGLDTSMHVHVQGNNMMMQSNGGFGAPMGSGPPIGQIQVPKRAQQTKQATTPEKEDPFAQFGSNVFRG